MSYSTDKYLSFTRLEQKTIALTIFVSAFVLSFRNWGIDTFDVAFGLRELILTTIIVALSLFLKLVVQKYAGIKVGLKTEFVPWFIGLFLSIAFVFMSNGRLMFLAVGGLVYGTIETLRVGHQYDFKQSTMSWIAFIGIMTNIIVGGIAKVLLDSGIGSSVIMERVIGINFWLVIYAVIPLPMVNTLKNINANDGLTILYTSRPAYCATFIITIMSMLSILFLPLWLGIITTALVSLLCWLSYIYFVEYAQVKKK